MTEKGLLDFELRNNSLIRHLKESYRGLLKVADDRVLLLPQSASLEGIEISRTFVNSHLATVAPNHIRYLATRPDEQHRLRFVLSGEQDQIFELKEAPQAPEASSAQPLLIAFNPFELAQPLAPAAGSGGAAQASAAASEVVPWSKEDLDVFRDNSLRSMDDPIIILRQSQVPEFGRVFLIHRPVSSQAGGSWALHPTAASPHSSGQSATAPPDSGLSWLFSGGLVPSNSLSTPPERKSRASTHSGAMPSSPHSQYTEPEEDLHNTSGGSLLSPVPSEAEEENDMQLRDPTGKKLTKQEKKRREDFERKRLRDQFFEKMKNSKARELARQIKGFVATCSDPASVTVSPDRVREFLDEMHTRVLNHRLWTDSGKRGVKRTIPQMEVEETAEALERFVCCKLYPSLFAPTPQALEADRTFSLRLKKLAFLEPVHFDIDINMEKKGVARLFSLALSELKAINNFRAPRDKMICCLNACNALWKLMDKQQEGSGKPLGADDFLPHLVYAVLKANPPHLPSNLEYVQDYRHPNRQQQEPGYYWTQLSSTVHFLGLVGPDQLTIDPKLFYELSGDTPPPGLAAPLETEQEQEEPEEDPEDGDYDSESWRRSESSEHEEPEEEFEDQPPQYTKFQTAALQGLPMTFAQRTAESLTIAEIPVLLAEYKRLAERLQHQRAV